MKAKRTYNPETVGALCSQCPLNGVAYPCPPQTRPGYTSMLVGDVPSRQEEVAGTPFRGVAGLMLSKLMVAAGWGRNWQSKVHLTYAVLCRPNIFKGSWKDYDAWLRLQNRKELKAAKAEKRLPELKLSPLECCKPRLLKELEQARQNAKQQNLNAVAVPLGPSAAALQALTGHGSYMRYRGSALPGEK